MESESIEGNGDAPERDPDAGPEHGPDRGETNNFSEEFAGDGLAAEGQAGDDFQEDPSHATNAGAGQDWLPFPLKPAGVRPPLTATQKQVLDFIYEYRAKHGVSPTLQEIGDRLKTHRVTVHAHVKSLLDKKYLVRFSERASRSLIPFDELAAREGNAKKAQSNQRPGDRSRDGEKPTKKSAIAPLPHGSNPRDLESQLDQTIAGPSALMFPLAGKIAAGRPIEAVFDNEVLDVQALFPRERDLFVLEVVGESMIDEQIRGGDYVICEKRTAARNGEIVVAVLPTEYGSQGEATLKRFFREGKRIRLQPANRAMAPIYIEPPVQLEIRGVVVGVIRRYRN
ncbi:MAG: repressor LexA [Planctomycetes bacterium]|nr:repressor LexA [Planctomycetota bacterium]